MPLTKSKGNMYPWTTHTHSHLRGECPHRCGVLKDGDVGYCYVQAMERRFGGGRYTGPVRLDEKEFAVNYGKGKTIFIEHCNDLFANAVPDLWIGMILNHCKEWQDNAYVFQTKNPSRIVEGGWLSRLPMPCIIGTTIETDREELVSRFAPKPANRVAAMVKIPLSTKRFVTIEPIHDFNIEVMLTWLIHIAPNFVNIGADSKRSLVPEPAPQKVRDLIAGIQAAGIEIRQKHNLERLLKGDK